MKHKFTEEQETYLTKIVTHIANGDIKLTGAQIKSISRVLEKKEYGEIDRVILNSIRNTYRYFIEKNERVEI